MLNRCGIFGTYNQADNNDDLTLNSLLHNESDENMLSRGSNAVALNIKVVLDVVLVDSCLSIGQKQLLSVARILLWKPQFVLLDEASSSLDPRTEAHIYKILQEQLPSTTTLLAVNHRYERNVIQQLCPQVLELSEGQVVRFDREVSSFSS